MRIFIYKYFFRIFVFREKRKKNRKNILPDGIGAEQDSSIVSLTCQKNPKIDHLYQNAIGCGYPSYNFKNCRSSGRGSSSPSVYMKISSSLRSVKDFRPFMKWHSGKLLQYHDFGGKGSERGRSEFFYIFLLSGTLKSTLVSERFWLRE